MTARKAAYVRAEAAKPHDGTHLCHALGCERPVAPAHLMCAPHWRLVPAALQREIWHTYRPGQERDKHPSREYVQAQKRAIDAVASAVRTENRRCPQIAEPPAPAPNAPPDPACVSCRRTAGVRLAVEQDARLYVLCVPCWYAWIAGAFEVGP